MRAIAKTITFAGDHPDHDERFQTFGNEHLPTHLGPQPYSSPADVPVPLRHTLRQAHRSGLTTKNLSLLFELPEAWIELFCLPDQNISKN